MAGRVEPRLGYVPHFDITTVDGRRLQYRHIWQRRNLVLVLAAPAQVAAAVRFAFELDARRDEFDAADTTVAVSTDQVPGLSPPRVVVADRWGEILNVDALPPDSVEFPSAEELLSWVRFAQIQCPECPP